MKYFVVAELGISHQGNMDEAKARIHAAAEAGADAVKLQYYDWRDIKDEFEGRKLVLEQVKQAQLELRQIRKLRDYMTREGVNFVCTPFKTRRKLLQLARLKPHAVKIRFRDGPNSSPDGIGLVRDALDSRLVQRVFASCLIPPFDRMSVMYSPKLSPAFGGAWMYCLPAYPPTPEDFNPSQSTAFNGFSDHYPHLSASLVAAALTRFDYYVIEKHIDWVNESDPVTGPDVAVSISFKSLGELVEHLRLFERLKPVQKLWFPKQVKVPTGPRNPRGRVP